MKNYNTLPEIESRITEIRDDLRYRVNLDTDHAVNLGGELADLEIKRDLLLEFPAMKKYQIGDSFNYFNHNKTLSEVVKISAITKTDYVFESSFTPGMRLSFIKVDDMISKGKLSERL